MISTELATRILLTVIIVGAFTINYSIAGKTGTTTNSLPSSSPQNEQSHSVKPKPGSVNIDEQSSSLDSPVALSSSSPTSVESARSLDQIVPQEENAGSRLFSDSAEAGILLPYEDDFPRPAGDNPRAFPDMGDMLPASVAFTGRPIGLRIANGKALEQPRESFYGMDPGQAFKDDMKKTPTYFLRNSCFGPRCLQQQANNDPNSYFSSKEGKAKIYDGGSRSNNFINAATRYEDNVMESMSSNFHSQIAIPFMVVDENSMKGGSLNSKYSNRLGLLSDRFSRMTTTPSPVAPEGWVRLNAISPDAYDPFRFTRNHSSKGDDSKRSTFNKRDSSASASNMLTKRVGVELNPESFADRWGWNENNNNNNNDQDDRRGGSRLPAWLEDQLKYGNRNSDQDKNWVKLEPIPVAGVTISKWVPKGTPLSKLPTTNWQTSRDRPNGGSAWWDRIDDINRIASGSRPFLRPSGGGGGGNDDGGRYNGGGGGGGGNGGGWQSNSNNKGSSLSTFDRYPTNSWNDIIYPEGPQSATVSWQQSKGISNRPSSFVTQGGGGGGNGDGGGWGSGGDSDTRRPPIVTGSWSAPPTRNRYPSSSNRYNDHRASASSYPNRQSTEDDPRWVLISNTRRVTPGSSGPNYNRGNSDLLDRSKILSYINRLHPDLDRRSDFPFHEPHSSSSHRHGKDYWPIVGGLSTSAVVISPDKDEAFHRVNATLSSLTPVLIHRGGTGTTVSQQFGDSNQSQPSRFESSVFQEHNGESNTNSNTNSDIILGSTVPPMLSTYFGDGRGTSNSAPYLQSSTITPFRNSIPGRIRQGLKNINPVYAAVGAGMIPATLAAVMPMMLGRRRRKRRDISSVISQPESLNHFPYFLLSSALYSNNDKQKISGAR